MRYRDWAQSMAKEYATLMHKVEDALEGEDLDCVVPMLATLLAEAGWMSGMDKKSFITYVVGSIDRGFLEMERNNGPRPNNENY